MKLNELLNKFVNHLENADKGELEFYVEKEPIILLITTRI